MELFFRENKNPSEFDTKSLLLSKKSELTELIIKVFSLHKVVL